MKLPQNSKTKLSKKFSISNNNEFLNIKLLKSLLNNVIKKLILDK